MEKEHTVFLCGYFVDIDPNCLYITCSFTYFTEILGPVMSD